MHLGIDASNITIGGGLTHLAQLLRHFQPSASAINHITLWACKQTLSALPNEPWLTKIELSPFEARLPGRLFWHQFKLPLLLKKLECDVFFSPGGLLPHGIGIPSVVMNQNLLPFQKEELARIPFWSKERLKMALLRRAQISAMERASGAIFLTQHAQNVVTQNVRALPRRVTLIPHGLEERFISKNPTFLKAPHAPGDGQKLRILYVSTVFYYKHPWNVVEAIATLRKEGFAITLDLVGSGNPRAIERLQASIARHDPQNEFIRYLGGLNTAEIHKTYQDADLFVFASSCETFGSTLLEAMGAGLPIATSWRGPMRELLGEDAEYFDPLVPAEIALAVEKLIADSMRRNLIAKKGYERSQTYSWAQCANATFRFLSGLS